MEINIITLDMIFALGIKEFSGVSSSSGMIDQFKVIDNIIQFWDSREDEWSHYANIIPWRERIEKQYPTLFTWELVNNEV